MTRNPLPLKSGDGSVWKVQERLINVQVAFGERAQWTGLWIYPHPRPNYDVIMGINLIRTLGFEMSHPEVGPFWDPKKVEVIKNLYGPDYPVDEITRRKFAADSEVPGEEGGIQPPSQPTTPCQGGSGAVEGETDPRAKAGQKAEKAGATTSKRKKTLSSPMDIWGSTKEVLSQAEGIPAIMEPQLTLIDDKWPGKRPSKTIEIVQLPAEIVMPPDTCRLIQYPLQTVADRDQFFEPNMRRFSNRESAIFITPSYVHKGDANVWLEIRNASAFTEKLDKDEAIGWMLPAYDVCEDEGRDSRPGWSWPSSRW